MNGMALHTATKLGLFGAALLAVFAVAAGVGGAVGPIDVSEAGHGGGHGSTESSSDSGGQSTPHGVSVAAAGYRLLVDATRIRARETSTFTFRVVDVDGAPVTEFEDLHERRLHLIVLNRDLVEYHHLHPALGEGGVWSIELPPLPAGSYRLFADTQPVGAENITLAADILVIGSGAPAELPQPSTSEALDDLVVSYAGEPRVGDTDLTFTVARAGEPIATEPYLGAAGHLVAIRSDDLAFLHVHPHDSPNETATVTFTAEFPTSGVYRLFFDFSVDGVVRTAAFTVDVDGSTSSAAHEGD